MGIKDKLKDAAKSGMNEAISRLEPKLGIDSTVTSETSHPDNAEPVSQPQEQPPANVYVQVPTPSQPTVIYASQDTNNWETIKPRVRASVPAFVKDSLSNNEEVLCAFNASLFDHHRRKEEFRHDKFILTTTRIICYHTALIHKGMTQIPYSAITNVGMNRGYRHGKIIVDAASGVGLTMDGINNDDAAFAERIIAGSVAGRRFMAG